MQTLWETVEELIEGLIEDLNVDMPYSPETFVVLLPFNVSSVIIWF